TRAPPPAPAARPGGPSASCADGCAVQVLRDRRCLHPFAIKAESKQPDDAAVESDVDRIGGGDPGQAWHGHDLSADRHHELRSRREAHFPYRHHVIVGRALGVGISRETVLSLGDADRVVAVAHLLERLELVTYGLRYVDVLRPVDFASDRADLLDQRHLVGIEEFELALAAVHALEDGTRHIRRAFATLGPVVGHDGLDAELLAALLHQRDLRVGVGAETIDGHDRDDAELLHIFDMAGEVGPST